MHMVYGLCRCIQGYKSYNIQICRQNPESKIAPPKMTQARVLDGVLVRDEGVAQEVQGERGGEAEARAGSELQATRPRGVISVLAGWSRLDPSFPLMAGRSIKFLNFIFVYFAKCCEEKHSLWNLIDFNIIIIIIYFLINF